MPTSALLDPDEPLERQLDKLGRICDALMRRVEQAGDDRGAAYTQFQRAVLLEDKVRERTRDLERALDLLNESNARLAAANRETERARSDLANAIETIQEGFALFDPDDRLVLCNSRFGLNLPDLRGTLTPGLPFEDYVRLVSRSSHLDLPPGTMPEEWAVTRMARHGEPHVMLNVRLAGDRWIQVSEHRMAGGQTVIMQTDVTDVIRAEREEQGRLLDDQARLIRATLEHLSQGVCIVDKAGRLAGFNLRLGTLLGLPLQQLRPGLDFEPAFRRLLAEATPVGTSVQDVLGWTRRRDRRPPLRFGLHRGEAQWLDVSAEEMPDQGFVMSVTDVSAEREAARALSEANEMLEARVASRTLELEDALAAAERANASRTRFVAAASHDLLQPLSAAKLYLSSIADELGEPLHREVVTKAQNALSSVQDIIEALLDISKLESGRASAEIRPVALGPLLAQLRDEFAPAAALKGLRLVVVPSSLRIMTDPSYMKRILQNLIGNAIRYTDRGGVLVGARRTGLGVRIGVLDTGPGIPEAEQENVFKEFHRLGRRASASEGLGLGLAIVDRACAMLGHPLTLESVLGRGTAFTISAPRAERIGPYPIESRRTGATGEWRHDGLTVLVIENDLDMRRALALLLRGWGVEVLDAGSGAEALRLIEAEGRAPDALLVDFQLDEGETGTAAIRRLRRRIGRVPTRIVTANRTPEVLREARRIGVELLHKPLDPLMLHLFLGSVTLGRPG
ncbi:Signal transduction histidine kinase [Rubellimicrobium mesophilum DSM 19309]|uniref:histidine kinase n=1 Tax=Rubellimicrobium mesophilum DSM 19309 TaxID=442562 RepID=A0A017HVC7_9RHOB|nr:PAS-domain containing protein [Rubellimicrobium mesophilum]EYD78078.1 Signal transduction histidine kinase [Rubellimicrobium mesophilum DSM 19309]